jgi:23S rRNA pseudouridine955/2504/2580 synthase
MAAMGHPIVGDGKYGGADSFLTGGISRKLHLHARRLKIDALGGGNLDVTAELPEHFAQSLQTLGFEIASAKATPRPATKPKARPGTKPRGPNRRGERRARSGRGRK